jgi:hypothetical protein
MPLVTVSVATTNPKGTSKTLHTARGIQERNLDLLMRALPIFAILAATDGALVQRVARKLGNESVLM